MSLSERFQTSLVAGVLVAGAFVAPSSVHAQEAMYTEAATMPSPGVVTVRSLVHYSFYGRHPVTGVSDTRDLELGTSVQYGLARDWSLTIDVPVMFRREVIPSETPGASSSVDHDQGVEDLDFTFKYRFYKHDTGGIDTVRAALLLGSETPSGDDEDFSSQAFNPHVGGVVTVVRGRHGFNQDAHFQLNTGGDIDHNSGGDGPDDAIFHNTSYLFRISPERYTAETKGSWYATIELSGIYETNGDYELRYAPGIMYEAWTFALEAMVQLPLYKDLDERYELDLAVGFGVRFTF
ncbi:MAG: hypothetical protein SFZ23_13410 [Planctomycetota bacterium]|nr:hypothetical protein [Planctomycetota bacterium]